MKSYFDQKLNPYELWRQKEEQALFDFGVQPFHIGEFDDARAYLHFLQSATPEQLKAYCDNQMDQAAVAKAARLQWQKDHKAGLLPLKESK